MTFDTNRALQQGLGLHQAGRLSEAEQFYRQILAVDPDHADGLHLLGVIAHARGHNEAAVDLIGKAIARNSQVADFHCNIGSALHALGRGPEAEMHYKRALKLNPDHVESYNNFGNVLKEQGKLEEAQQQFRRALVRRPDYAEAHYNLGNVLQALGRTAEAIRHYQRAIALKPAMAAAHYNLGQAPRTQGKADEAAPFYGFEPGWAEAHRTPAMVHPADLALNHPHYFLQFRPDSDAVHKHLSIPGELKAFWMQGNEFNNGGDIARLYVLYQNLRALDERAIPGSLAELGVYKGNSAKILHLVSPARKLYLFDTFEGFDSRDVNAESQQSPVNDQAFKDTSLEAVQAFVGTDKKVVYCKGWFPDTAAAVEPGEKFAFVHIDCDLGQPVAAALDFFYPRTSPGGLIIIHDYSSGWWKDVKPAVDRFMADKPETPILLPDKSGSVVIARQRSPSSDPCPHGLPTA